MLVSHPIESYLSVLPDAYLSDKTFLIYEALKKAAKSLVLLHAIILSLRQAGWRLMTKMKLSLS